MPRQAVAKLSTFATSPPSHNSVIMCPFQESGIGNAFWETILLAR